MIENSKDRLSLENPLSDSFEEQVAAPAVARRRHPSMFSQQRRKLTNGKEGEKKKRKKKEEEEDSGHSFSINHGSQLSGSAFHVPSGI